MIYTLRATPSKCYVWCTYYAKRVSFLIYTLHQERLLCDVYVARDSSRIAVNISGKAFVRRRFLQFISIVTTSLDRNPILWFFVLFSKIFFWLKPERSDGKKSSTPISIEEECAVFEKVYDLQHTCSTLAPFMVGSHATSIPTPPVQFFVSRWAAESWSAMRTTRRWSLFSIPQCICKRGIPNTIPPDYSLF